MASTIAISQTGGKLAGGGNDTGIPSGGGNPPGNVSGITVTGTLDPIAREISLVVTFTAPTGSGETWTGVHLYLDLPDHADGSTTAVVGTAIVGTSKILGPFSPIDLGIQTNPTQPWEVSFPFPGSLGLDPTQDIPCRLYLASVSVVSANELIQNTTPNQAFTLVSLASGSPTAGTNITPNCGTITCQALTADTSTGKSMSPFVALMGSVPSAPPKGWGYKLYLYKGAGVPATVNDPAMTALTDVCTVAGIVPAGKSDLVTDVLNSFAIQTPGTASTTVVYAVAGLVSAGGVFQANNIVPGITNSCIIKLGSSSGTIDASQAMLASLSAEMSVIAGKFGITLASLDNNFLASGAAGANLVAAGPVLNAGTVISNNTITGALLATSGIITLSAQVGTAVIADANIGSCNVSKLTAGTATFSSTVVFQSASGPAVTITSTQVALTGGAYTIGLNSSSGITISSSGQSLAITSSAVTITNGSYSATFGASSIVLAYSGGPNLSLYAGSIYLSATASDYIEVTAGTITMVSSGNTTTINGGTGIMTIGGVYATTVQVQNLLINRSLVTSGVGAGGVSLPATCAGFVLIEVGGVTRYVAVY